MATLARPGGNITGFSNFEPSMGGKWIEKLKQIAPHLRRVALLFNPSTSPHIAAGYYLRSAEEAGREFGLDTVTIPVRDVLEMQQKIGSFAEMPNGGVVVLPDSFTITNADIIVQLAKHFGLPAVYPFSFFAARNALMVYGIDVKDQYPAAASYVDRILRGESPAELPVQFASKFQLIINLQTAKGLGLDIPLHIQQLADVVID